MVCSLKHGTINALCCYWTLSQLLVCTAIFVLQFVVYRFCIYNAFIVVVDFVIFSVHAYTYAKL